MGPMTRLPTRMTCTAIRALGAALLAILLVGPLVPPAYACACGAMEPVEGRDLGVESETAAIRFDGSTETIALSMNLNTDSEQVAFLLPLPTRAEPGLGGTELFDELYEHTRPEERVRYDYWPDWGAAGAGAAGDGTGREVEVLGRQQVGNYDVVQLTGEQRAVGQWLTDNGFRTRPEVLAGLADYLADGWVVMAVKLAFVGPFRGPMAPLTVSFPTTGLVYPMLLSSQADHTQRLRFYVFADHRLDLSIGSSQLETTFAGWVDGGELQAAGYLDAAAFAGDHRWFLTRVDDRIRPERITTDLQFARSAHGDAEHREVTWRTVDRGDQTLLAAAIVLVAGVAVTAVLVRARTRRPAGRTRRPG